MVLIKKLNKSLRKTVFFHKYRSRRPNCLQNIKVDVQISYLYRKMYIIAKLADCTKDKLACKALCSCYYLTQVKMGPRVFP